MFKAGKVIQNSQGRFAKIIEVKGTRYGLSAWVNRSEQAENETVVVRYLNSFGLKQVLPEAAPKKDAPKGDKAPAAPKKEDAK